MENEDEEKEHGAKVKEVDWEEKEVMWVVFQGERVSASCPIKQFAEPREIFESPHREKSFWH